MGTSFATLVFGLFAITGSIAVIPIFLAATDGQTGGERRKTALIAASTYVVALLVALFIGNTVLTFFGVSIASLRVAGMIVIAAIGWNMLNAPTPPPAGTSKTHHEHAASNTKIAIVPSGASTNEAPPASVGVMPLGFPIYAGPGSLSLVIAWGSAAGPLHIAAIVAILINTAAIIILDFLATPIVDLIGAEGLLVTEKVFGLIVLAIAVTGMASAFLVLFPGLRGTP